jgi:hypothetical protein
MPTSKRLPKTKRLLPIDVRKRKEDRWRALETERATWFDHWRDITQHLLPRSGRYFITDTNTTGRHLYNKIIDSTATQAHRIARSGMSTHLSSPARPWFKLTTPDPDLAKFHPVKVYLEDVQKLMMNVFSKANTYRALTSSYGELLAFGTSVSIVVADFERVIHHYPSPPGEYAIAQDNRGRIDTCYRRFEWTVGEVVQEFGFDNVSTAVQQQHDNNNLHAPVEILHAIEPRRERDPSQVDSLNMPWRSVYLEWGSEDADRGILRESGFERFPVLAPRWEVNGRDVYGHSPGMQILGDIRHLQGEQRCKAQAIEYMARPPLVLPTSLKGQERETLPGGRVFHDAATPAHTIKTLFDTRLDIGALREDIFEVKLRIDRGFFNDLFLSLGESPSTMTATEVVKRSEESLVQLGPALDQVHNELLDPLIDMAFSRMRDTGMLPEAPDELAGMDLGVEFISTLAQAQKLVGMNGIDRFTGNLMAVSEARPEALDKWNIDEYVDDIAERLGVPPKMVVPTEQAQELRDARNKAMAEKEQAEALKTQSETARNLAASPTDGANALTNVASTLGQDDGAF